MLYIERVYDTDDAIVCNSVTGYRRRMSKKQIIAKLQKTDILGAIQIDDDTIDLAQVSIFRFPTIDECEEYLDYNNLRNEMQVYVDEENNYEVYGALMSSDVYHVKYVVYAMQYGYGNKVYPLYVRDDGKYTPYVEEAMDLSMIDAIKKAAGMTKSSRSGNRWYPKKIYTDKLVCRVH